MKNIKFRFFLILFLAFGYNIQAQTITFRGCLAVLSAQDYTLSQTGTTNDGGTIRNTYEATPNDFTQNCAAGVCEVRIIWNIGATRWEIQLDNDGPLGTPDYTTAVLYFNNSASFPNPPDLTLGTWLDGSGGICSAAPSNVSGTGTQSTLGAGAAEIDILGNGNSIVDGDVTPSTTDDTNFGNVSTGGNDVHTFTIDNIAGTATLNVATINVSGANAGDFVIGGITLPANIAAGATTTFTLTFTPSAVGVRNATVTVNNDDANEATYDYTVRGTGVVGGLPSCITFSAPAGTTNTWMGCVDDDWSNGLNWSTGIVPTASDVIYVPANPDNSLVINEVATCAKMIVEIGGVCTIDYNAGGKLVVKF